MQCVALTRKKVQCQNTAKPGQLVCGNHMGHKGPANSRQLSPEARSMILEEVKSGAPPLAAGAAVGIGSDDMQILLDGDTEFATEVENAVLALQAENYKSIAKAAKSDWRAAVWLQDRMVLPRSPTVGGPSAKPGGGASEGRIPQEHEPDPNFKDDQVGPDGKPL